MCCRAGAPTLRGTLTTVGFFHQVFLFDTSGAKFSVAVGADSISARGVLR